MSETSKRVVVAIRPSGEIELPNGEVIEVPPGMPSWAIDVFVDEWSAALDRQTAEGVSAAVSRVRAFLDARGARAADETERAGGLKSDAQVVAGFDGHYLLTADLRLLLATHESGGHVRRRS